MSPVVLLCAATKVEAKAIRKGIDDSGFKKNMEICLTGMGLEASALALTQWLDSAVVKPARIISTGFIGTSISEAPVGSWILGRKVCVEGSEDSEAIELNWLPVNSALASCGLSWKCLDITSTATVTNLSSLENPPAAVDMESFALARVARQRSIDFQVFRLVSDTPSEPIPEAIASFASFACGGLAKGKREGFLKLIEATGHVLSRPVPFVRFAARASRLPRILRAGWKEAAPLFVSV